MSHPWYVGKLEAWISCWDFTSFWRTWEFSPVAVFLFVWWSLVSRQLQVCHWIFFFIRYVLIIYLTVWVTVVLLWRGGMERKWGSAVCPLRWSMAAESGRSCSVSVQRASSFCCWKWGDAVDCGINILLQRLPADNHSNQSCQQIGRWSKTRSSADQRTRL